MIQKVHVKVPATSANMGSGFDAVGIALTLYNEIIFEETPAGTGLTIEIKGLGQDTIPLDPKKNMVTEAMEAEWPGFAAGPRDTDQPDSTGPRHGQQFRCARRRYHGW